MSNRTATFGDTNQYSIIYPQKNVYAFSPYAITITGTSSFQEVIMQFGDILHKKYTGIDNKCYFQIGGKYGALSSFFNGVNFGVIGAENDYVNESSKSMALDKTIKVSIGQYYINIDFDIYWGAIQQCETLKSIETIYRFGTLPLTITQNVGVLLKTKDYGFSQNCYGKEVFINSLSENYDTSEIIIFKNNSPATIIQKKYKIKYSECEDGIYVRWLSLLDGYKYFLFKFGQSDVEIKNGASIDNRVDSLDSVDGIYKIDNKYISNNTSKKKTICAVGGDELTDLMESMATALLRWVYVGNGEWQEVNVSDSKITRKKMEGNREFKFEISFNENYSQSL